MLLSDTTGTSTTDIAPLQPFHSSPMTNGPLTAAMAKLLSKDFQDFYNSTMLGTPSIMNTSPVLKDMFNGPKGAVLPGDRPPVPVGKEEEFVVPRKYTNHTYPSMPIAVYTPPGTPPSGGWPVIFDIHGGAFVFATCTFQQSILTRMCVDVKAVVVSPEYRMAPDWSYPAAIEDCWEALLWTYEQGPSKLGIDVSRFAIAGLSAGGSLAATMINMLISEKSSPKDLKFALCCLTVPACDNTAGDPTQSARSPTWNKYKSWTECADSPALSANMMIWARNLFLPNIEHRSDWHASPNLVPDHFWAKHPPTRLAICEIDILRDMGLYYADKLKAAGVSVEVEVYKSAPHSAPVLAGVMEVGRRIIDENIGALKKALWPNGFDI